MAEKIIADALDTALARYYEQLGDAEREKQAVVFMDGRWVAIRGDFTPDEIREAVEYIHRYRSSQKLQASMEETSPFVVKNGEVFIKEANIAGGATHAESIEAPQPVTNTYNISLGIRRDDTVHFAGIGVDTNLEALIENAVKNAAKDVEKKVTDDQKSMDDLTSFIREAIRNECRPGGLIWHKFGRR
ncbi:TPA: hypothetical protein KE767_004291 [Citrobacter koseri]|nr:hypothetical protein [Citrobacter koseri]